MGNKNSPQAKKNALASKYMPSFKDTAGVAVDRALRFGRSEAGKHGSVLGVHLDDRPNGSMVVCSEFTIELFNPISGDRRLRKTPFGNGTITCVDFKDNTCFGKPVLVYGTSRGFIYFLELEELTLVKAVEVDVLTSGNDSKKEENNEVEYRADDTDEHSGIQMKDVQPKSSNVGTSSALGTAMEEEEPGIHLASSASGARALKSGWQRRSGKGISSVNYISPSSVLVGGDDGRVHEFGIDYGGTTILYRPPLDGAFDISPVVNAIPVGDSSLIVGYKNGDIHVYARKNAESKKASNMRTGKWQQKLPSLNVSSSDVLIAFQNLNGFCTFDSASHICRMYMLSNRAAKLYDFSAIMSKLNLSNSYVTSAWYDDDREVLFTGHSDGTFLLRDIQLDSSDGIAKMQISKVGKAAHKMQTVPTAPRGRREVDHVSPTCITSLRYDGQNDQLLIGDFQGISRVKTYASGRSSIKVRATRGSSLQGGDDSISDNI